MGEAIYKNCFVYKRGGQKNIRWIEIEVTMIYAVYENSQFKLEIEYIFNLVLSIYGIKWQVIDYSQLPTLKLRLPAVVISYGKHQEKNYARAIQTLLDISLQY